MNPNRIEPGDVVQLTTKSEDVEYGAMRGWKPESLLLVIRVLTPDETASGCFTTIELINLDNLGFNYGPYENNAYISRFQLVKKGVINRTEGDWQCSSI